MLIPGSKPCELINDVILYRQLLKKHKEALPTRPSVYRAITVLSIICPQAVRFFIYGNPLQISKDLQDVPIRINQQVAGSCNTF